MDRTFTPDLLHRQGDIREFWCAHGQLTGVGFRQMAGLGRHFAQVYEEFLTSAPELRVRSVDSKRTMASAVGVLLTLLAVPGSRGSSSRRDDKMAVQVNSPSRLVDAPLQSNEGLFTLKEVEQAGLSTEEIVGLGDHLLTRWCHQYSLPCRSGASSSSSGDCMSIQDAVKIVTKGEAEMCSNLSSSASSMSSVRS